MDGNEAALELVLPDGTRVLAAGEIVVGRERGSTMQIDDPSVSRAHARIVVTGTGGTLIEDAGSSSGTFVDGRQITGPTVLRDGSRVRVGDYHILVERRERASLAGDALVVPTGTSLRVTTTGASLAPAVAEYGVRPRLRSGFALKRLAAGEGARRWVLKDIASGSFVRLSDNDVELVEALDGRHELADLIAEAERRFGPAGPKRLARLLAQLADRELLAGVAANTHPTTDRRRVLAPRELIVPGAGRLIEGAYRTVGWVLFLRPVLLVIGLLAAAGLPAVLALVAGRYGVPFIVAEKLGLGVVTFALGGFAVLALHELAHALAMASFGMPIREAGIKLRGIFVSPYVDRSELWFAPRTPRMAGSAAGPLSDLTLGAIFAIGALSVAAGTLRDVLIQLAVAAYVIALLTLDPLHDRDGYRLLVDGLREPDLRRRATEQLSRRLSGLGPQLDRPVLGRYALFVIAWAIVVNLVLLLPGRYEAILEMLVPMGVVWAERALRAALWFAFFGPVLFVIARSLLARARPAKPAF